MFDTSSGRTIGILLVALGALALLGNFGFFGGRSLFGALLFAGLGAYLLRLSRQQSGRLWAFIGAFGLFGLALAAISGPLSGSYFLAMLGAGFALAYRQDGARWWAIIPAGVLFTLAAVAGLESIFPRASGGPVFFLGLAATFGLVYLRHRRWAVYPAIALAVLALLSASFVSSWLFPLALLGGGLYLLSRQPRYGAPATTSAPEPEAAAAEDAEPKALESANP